MELLKVLGKTGTRNILQPEYIHRLISVFCFVSDKLHRFPWLDYIILSFQVPQLFLDGKHVGGEKEITRMHANGELKKLLTSTGAI